MTTENNEERKVEVKQIKKEETNKRSIDIINGNVDIRKIEALFNINNNIYLLVRNLDRVAKALESLNTKAELYKADALKDK